MVGLKEIYQHMLSLRAQFVLDEAVQKSHIKTLKSLINESLDTWNEEDFFKYTKELLEMEVQHNEIRDNVKFS